MEQWYVINNVGRIVAGPYFSKEVAETFIHHNPYLKVIKKDPIPK